MDVEPRDGAQQVELGHVDRCVDPSEVGGQAGALALDQQQRAHMAARAEERADGHGTLGDEHAARSLQASAALQIGQVAVVVEPRVGGVVDADHGTAGGGAAARLRASARVAPVRISGTSQAAPAAARAPGSG